MRDHVWKRLWDLLTYQEGIESFTTHLWKDDRQAIVEILHATRADFPASWTSVERR